MVRSSLLYLLLITAAFGCTRDVTIKPWDLISNKASFVLEKRFSSLADSNNVLIDTALHQELKKINPNLLISFQPINATEFDVLYLAEISKDSFNTLTDRFKSNQRRLSERNYNGKSILEFNDIKLKKKICFSYISGVLVISESSLLVEDCIRQASSEETKNKSKLNRELLNNFTMVRGDDGNLYTINSEIVSYFEMPSWTLKLHATIQKDVASLLDIKSTDEGFLMNGFSAVTDSSSFFYKLQKQQSVPIEINRYIPNYTTHAFHFGISDLSQFYPDSTFTSIAGNEIAFFNTRSDKPCILLKFGDKIEKSEILNFLQRSGTLYEMYGGSEIYQLNTKNSLTGFIGQFISTDSSLFATTKDRIVLIASTSDEIKHAIEFIDRDETWGKSLAFQDFLEKGLQESNYSFFLHNVTIQPAKSQLLKSILKDLNLQSISFASVQHSALDNHFYTNINIARNRIIKPSIKASGILFNSSVRSVTPAPDVSSVLALVEDSEHQIHAITSQGKKIWKFDLEGGVINRTSIVDYLKNKKYQFSIATKNKHYIIDRLGRTLTGYPLSLPIQASHHNVIDYDLSKNYRFLISGEQEIYLFDKDRKSLPGWNPRKLNSEVRFTPEHYRIGGKDYFFIITADHSVHLITRRGEEVGGYPKSTQIKISGDYHIQKGTSLTNTFLNAVSSDGVLIKMNLGTQAIEQIQLVRNKDATFQLVQHKTKQGFSVLRMDAVQLAVFDETGRIQFEVSNPGSIQLQPSIFSRKDGTLVYTFFDPVQKITFLFDLFGASVAPGAVESTLPLTIAYDMESKIDYLISVKDNVVTLTPFN